MDGMSDYKLNNFSRIEQKCFWPDCPVNCCCMGEEAMKLPQPEFPEKGTMWRSREGLRVSNGVRWIHHNPRSYPAFEELRLEITVLKISLFITGFMGYFIGYLVWGYTP